MLIKKIHKANISVLSTYDVDAGERAASKTERRLITPSTNLLQVIIAMYIRFNMCATAEDVLSSY